MEHIYKRGYIREDGRVFSKYQTDYKRGKEYEVWYKNMDAFLVAQQKAKNYKQRNKDKNNLSQQKYREENRDKLRETARLNYKANPEKFKETRNVWKQKQGIKRIIQIMLYNAENRARKKNIEFNLKYEDILIPDFCPVLNIPITSNSIEPLGTDNNKSRGPTPNSISLDRIDNSKGYTKDNIRIISYRANVLKRDGTLEELEKIVAYMKANLIKPV